MTRRYQDDYRLSAAVLLVVLVCAVSALAQADKKGAQQGGKGDQPQTKQAAGQGGKMADQQGMGGMGMT